MAGTVAEAFAARAVPHGAHLFLIVPARADRDWHPNGGEFSYAAAAAEIARLRERYGRTGFGHGHRVALLLESRPEFFFHYLALNGLGVGIVPISPDYRHDEMLYLMDHSEADLAVSLPDRTGDLEAIARERAKPLPLATPELDRLARPEPPPRSGAPGIDTECSLLYTSGTTGRPKGCILTNLYYLNCGRWYRDLGGRISFEPGRERLMNPLPLFHMNAQAVSATAMMLTAGCLVLPGRFSPSRWWADVVASRATIIHYLGVMPPLLLNQAPCDDERRHRVKFGIGAGIEPELHAAFEKRFGFPLIEVWGMTETGR